MKVTMKRPTSMRSLHTAALALAFSLIAVPWQSPCLANNALQNVLNQFSPYDMDGDGVNEIDSFELASFESAFEVIPGNARLVLVLVEPRLLASIAGSPISGSDVMHRLQRFKGDLEAEGYVARVVWTSVYAGNAHQDGRTVLALRQFLKTVRGTYNNLQGAVLIGSFPEPMLARRWLWQRTAGDAGITIGGTKLPKGTEYLRIVPEIVAERADLVLADLDGDWPSTYQKGPMSIESIVAKPDVPAGSAWYQNNALLTCTHYDRTNVSFQDFFWIQDDNYVAWLEAGKLKIRIFTDQLHPEMNNQDLSLANPLARPDIFVSRINPLHIAVNPDAKFLDGQGKPQSVFSATPVDLGIKAFWKRDSVLERRILVDYLDRNHAYRVGGYSHLPFRTAAVGKDLSATGMNNMLLKASSDFGASVIVEDASLLAYVNWLKQSGSYRGITAHSNAWNSTFGDNYNLGALEAAVGGQPWRWKKQGNTNLYEPSLADQGGGADLYLHRTLWENGVLQGTGGRLYLHNGCQANSPERAAGWPYNNEFYGTFQNVEGVLFYLNGVALAARAKVFYDTPRGFSEALGAHERAHFGNGWRAYFDEEGKDAGLVTAVADNKRCYTWSVLGDWSVRLRYRNGLGILGVAGSELADRAIHANNAWIGGWNYSSNVNPVAGVGDFNGDGRADIILVSTWGMGIVYHDGTSWQALMVKPGGTWFGGWTYNPDDNVIRGIGDFDGNGKDDILITSPWGIGILTLQGSTLTSLVARPNGSVFGSWLYNGNDNVIEGIGNIDGVAGDEIVISSPWGLGVLALEGSTLGSIITAPKGTGVDGWLYNPDDNVIHDVADFDGNGADDILITSPWGIGILKMQGPTLTAMVAKPGGTGFGGWLYNPADNVIQSTGDFDGNGTDDIVISSPWGIGLLKVQGSTLAAMVAKPAGTSFGGWWYNPDDNVIKATGDFNGNGSDDIVISSPWGIGVLTLAGSTLTSIDLAAHSQPVGQWHLEESDLVCGVGAFGGGQQMGVLLKKWQ